MKAQVAQVAISNFGGKKVLPRLLEGVGDKKKKKKVGRYFDFASCLPHPLPSPLTPHPTPPQKKRRPEGVWESALKGRGGEWWCDPCSIFLRSCTVLHFTAEKIKRRKIFYLLLHLPTSFQLG